MYFKNWGVGIARSLSVPSHITVFSPIRCLRSAIWLKTPCSFILPPALNKGSLYDNITISYYVRIWKEVDVSRLKLVLLIQTAIMVTDRQRFKQADRQTHNGKILTLQTSRTYNWISFHDKQPANSVHTISYSSSAIIGRYLDKKKYVFKGLTGLHNHRQSRNIPCPTGNKYAFCWVRSSQGQAAGRYAVRAE